MQGQLVAAEARSTQLEKDNRLLLSQMQTSLVTTTPELIGLTSKQGRRCVVISQLLRPCSCQCAVRKGVGVQLLVP